MLTLVAAVLVYDLAYEPVVDLIEGLEVRDAWSLGLLSRNARSETNEEKDILVVALSTQRYEDLSSGYLTMLTEAGAQGVKCSNSGDSNEFN